MNAYRVAGCYLGLVLAPHFAAAEIWQTTQGEGVEGKLAGVYGPLAMIAGKNGTRFLSMDALDDTALGRVADCLAVHRAAAEPIWKTSPSAVAKSLRGRLQVLRDGKLVAYDPGARTEPTFYLAYFGAHWCGPCRNFSPGFVQAYQRLQRAFPGRFEVVFVSNDRDADEQALYVREVQMPWPVVRYSSLGNVTPLERWAGPGIPCLVALTREGELIFHSYHGTEYVGPGEVLQQFENLLRLQSDDSDEARRVCHRLAVIQHLRSVGSGDSAPKPYLIVFDRAHYQTLEVKELKATLDLDERGRVTHAHFEPELPAVIDFQLNRDSANWLFLPAVVAGHAQPRKVMLPLAL